MGHTYNFGAYDKPFEGPVNSSGIYLSKDDFLKRSKNYTGVGSVGIHEMLHALAYVNIMAADNSAQDDAFKKDFMSFRLCSVTHF